MLIIHKLRKLSAEKNSLRWLENKESCSEIWQRKRSRLGWSWQTKFAFRSDQKNVFDLDPGLSLPPRQELFHCSDRRSP